MEEIEEEAQRLAGCQFNLASSAEVSNVLFNILKLAVPPNAKQLRGGKLYSTGAEVWFDDIVVTCSKFLTVFCQKLPTSMYTL